MSYGASHLVEILLPTQTGDGKAIGQDWFERLLTERTEKFGGATSFVRAPNKGLWQSGAAIEQDNIAVIEVMTDTVDAFYRAGLRQRLEKKLSQKEIVMRAHETRRLLSPGTSPPELKWPPPSLVAGGDLCVQKPKTRSRS